MLAWQGEWDERPTLQFPNGRAAARHPHFNVTRGDNEVAITTLELVLRFRGGAPRGGGFTNETLSITLLETGTVWRPGLGDDANLGGSRLDFGCYATFESCCTDLDNELVVLSPGSPSLEAYRELATVCHVW